MKAAVVTLFSLLSFLSAATAGTIRKQYLCTDGTRLVATFHTPATEPGTVTLVFLRSGKRLTLPRAISADGGRYADASTQFWIKGNGASLTHGDRNSTCRTSS